MGVTVNRSVAAIDIGTNSIRLLIQKPTPSGWVNQLQKRVVVRLGTGWNNDGRISEEKIVKARNVLQSFRQEAESFSTGKILAVGTQGLRQAKNGHEVRTLLEKALGTEIKIISGEEEARLSYIGAAEEWKEEKPWVLDIGGGSTELIGPEGMMKSFSLGSLLLSQRFGEGELPAMEEYIGEKLIPFTRGQFFPLVIGVGGTIANLVAMKKELKIFSEASVHGTEIELPWVLEILEKMKGLSPAEREEFPGLEKGRGDIILPGAVILKVTMELTESTKVIYSGRDILQGMVLKLG